MDKQEKEMFIINMADSIKLALLQKVSKIPEEWDGFELRQLFADYINEQVNYAKMDRKRKKAYNNARTVYGI